MVKQTQENPVGSRESTSMSNLTEEGHMDPREVGGVHLVIPQAIIGRGAKTSGEVQLVTDQPHTNERHKTNVLLGDLIPRTGVTRIK